MHPQARDFVASHRKHYDLCEFGSYDVNGGIRDLFPDHNYVGVDVRPGLGVDVVADCATWDGNGRRFDLVVCCEVLEHFERWQDIIANAARLLRPGGRLIVTAAGPSREPHTCNGKAWSPDCGEHYRNIDPDVLRVVCGWHFGEVHVECDGQDVRAVCVGVRQSESAG